MRYPLFIIFAFTLVTIGVQWTIDTNGESLLSGVPIGLAILIAGEARND